MARRPTPQPPQRANLNADQMQSGIRRLQKRIADLREFDPDTVEEKFPSDVTALEKAIEQTLDRVFENGTSDFERYIPAARLSANYILAEEEPIGDIRREFAKSKGNSLAILEQAVRSLEEEISEQSEAPIIQQSLPSSARKQKIFIVHGHDEGALQTLARFLEKLGLEAIVLKEQPDQGQTIIEKYETHANQVGFAVVLMTPDDVGSAIAESEQVQRARQNVIFELGYFAGKLGRGRVCLLRKGKIEMPSDLFGVIYTELDADEGWKQKLVREFKAANLDFDANRLWA